MAEFLRVEFVETRRVLADGQDVGQTNTTLMLAANEYIIRLSGTGYTPASHDVVLSNTDANNPIVIKFERTG